jgi:hypothetical protein
MYKTHECSYFRSPNFKNLKRKQTQSKFKTAQQKLTRLYCYCNQATWNIFSNFKSRNRHLKQRVEKI